MAAAEERDGEGVPIAPLSEAGNVAGRRGPVAASHGGALCPQPAAELGCVDSLRAAGQGQGKGSVYERLVRRRTGSGVTERLLSDPFEQAAPAEAALPSRGNGAPSLAGLESGGGGGSPLEFLQASGILQNVAQRLAVQRQGQGQATAAAGPSRLLLPEVDLRVVGGRMGAVRWPDVQVYGDF